MKYAIIDVINYDIARFFDTLEEAEEFDLANYLVNMLGSALAQESIDDYRLIEYNVIAKPEAEVIVQSNWNKNIW